MVLIWYIFSCYWISPILYCKCKDSYTYPYIFSSKSFDPVTVPLKWDSVELLHGDAVFSQDASDGGDAHMVYVVEHLPVCKYFLS